MPVRRSVAGDASRTGKLAGIKARGVGVVSRNGHHADSHCPLLKVAPFGAGQQVAARLEAANVIVNTAHLPQELGTEGIRLGVQEITRMGAVENDMEALAGLIADVITERILPQECLSQARQFAARFCKVHFTWE